MTAVVRCGRHYSAADPARLKERVRAAHHPAHPRPAARRSAASLISLKGHVCPTHATATRRPANLGALVAAYKSVKLV